MSSFQLVTIVHGQDKNACMCHLPGRSCASPRSEQRPGTRRRAQKLAAVVPDSGADDGLVPPGRLSLANARISTVAYVVVM